MKMELSLRLDKTLFEKKVPPKKITDKRTGNYHSVSKYLNRNRLLFCSKLFKF